MSIKYSKDIAYFLGRMALLAYEPSDSIRSTLTSLKSKNIVIYDKEDTQAFLSDFEDRIVIAFRGTESLVDWITDFDFGKCPEGNFEAHEGFIKALNLIWNELSELLQLSLLDGQKSIYLTGHSLGGGLASIASTRLWALGLEHFTYTFGCPRALSKDFSRHYNLYFREYTHRYVNNNDVVTRVPPREMNFGHIGTFHYFKEDGKQDDMIGWWSKLVDQIVGRLADIGKLGTDGIKDHNMKLYYNNLERNKDG